MALGPELRIFDRTHVVYDGRPYLFFGGTDYHRFATHPDVVAAALHEAQSSGLSCSGSRVTTGNNPLFGQLEARLAGFLGAEAAVLCSSGFLSNSVALESLSREYRRVFIDSSAHVSMKAAVRCLPDERVHLFRHGSVDDLERLMLASLLPGEQPLVLTDGVGAQDGALAPLAAYWEVVREREGLIVVDDAHGVGTIGAEGRGSPELARLPAEAFVQTGTLSKALGAFGGFVAGPKRLVDGVSGCSAAYMGATPIPPPLAAAALRSLDILQRNPKMIEALQERALGVRERLASRGFATGSSPAPIVSIGYWELEKNERMERLLFQRGIYLPLIRSYPGSPAAGAFRLSLSSAHSEREIEQLLDALTLSC